MPGPGTRRKRTGKQIALLYRALATLASSPVVELNRAVAVAMAFGPEVGLEIVEGLAAEPGAGRVPSSPQRPR